MAITADYYVDLVSGDDGNAGTSTGAPWLTYQKAFDTAVAGEKVAYKGDFTLTAVLDMDVNSGTSTDPIWHVHVNSSWEDDGTYGVIDAGSTYAYCINRTKTRHIFKNFHFTNSTSECVEYGLYWTFINCKFSNAGTDGAYGDNDVYHRCYFANNTTRGLRGNCLVSKSIFINNPTGHQGSSIRHSNNIVHNCSDRGLNAQGGLAMFDSCIIDNCQNGIMTQGEKNTITNNRITNSSLEGVYATGSYGGNVIDNNYFYNPSGADFTTYSGVYYDDSNRLTADNSSAGYTDISTDDFTIALGDGIGVETKIGSETEATNIFYISQGMGPLYASSTAPTFAGITGFEILNNNKFRVSWATGTGTVTSYNIYIRNATGVFNTSYLSKKVDSSITSTIIQLEGDQATFLTNGTLYYCGVKAENNGTEDSNVVELTNICSGSEGIQRMTNTLTVI